MSRSAHFMAITALLLLAGFSTGCATILGGTHKDVAFTSKPPAAHVTIYNAASGEEVDGGITPFTVRLKRGRTYFVPANYIAKCDLAGEHKEFHIRSAVSIWYVGNIFIGGLVGMIAIDPLTGAMWDPYGKVDFDFTGTPAANAGVPPASYAASPPAYTMPAPPLYAPNPASLPSIYQPLPAGAQ